MPVYPGTEPPQFLEACSLEKEGFRETLLTMYSHTGTHMDSPSHLFLEGKNLEDFLPDYFIGSALALDVSLVKGHITTEQLVQYQMELSKVDFLIFATGWEQFWGKEQYFNDFPALTQEAAKWLRQFKLKAVGVDAISVDAVDTASALPIHRILLGNDILIIENLKNVRQLVGQTFDLCCLPIKIAHANGAPVRVVAITSA